MKKLNITKEAFEKSKYFKHKYGKLEYVSESGKVFKTDKGKILKFKESVDNKEFRFKVKLLVQAVEALEEHVDLAKSQRRGVLKAKFDDSDVSVEDRLDEIESLLMDARALLK